ncbi:uncharacterized protein [Penaeus vannamei]|uniref:uncharacterized protein n=1 Tax=Penaeus vannamei TaxID=6689 RepID=UPI00387F6B35
MDFGNSFKGRDCLLSEPTATRDPNKTTQHNLRGKHRTSKSRLYNEGHSEPLVVPFVSHPGAIPLNDSGVMAQPEVVPRPKESRESEEHRDSQPDNQSTSPPVSQSTNPLVNLSAIQPVHQSTNPPVNQSTYQPVNQSTNPPVHRSSSQLLRRREHKRRTPFFQAVASPRAPGEAPFACPTAPA